MLFEHREFWLPKDTGHPEEYQDAFEVDPQTGVAALADGVSSSIFAGSWARLLVRGIVRGPFDAHSLPARRNWLGARREAWWDPINPQALSWHQKPKLQAGAQSTLLWLQLEPTAGAYELHCFAVGDSCLFVVYDNQVQRAFPIEESGLFSEAPQVLASVPQGDDDQPPFLTFEDTCEPGCLLVLCSDALAAWAIQELEQGGNPDWERLWSMSPEDWRDWITDLRGRNRLRYDDTTAVLLRPAPVPAASKPPVVGPSTSATDFPATIAGTENAEEEEPDSILGQIARRLEQLPGWRRRT